ncbi:MAG TPA: hypothetical protein VFR32_02490 [Gaiellaceae bacterium]|nr:hypothetical protein [Gaiellaceae bacterium]
MSDVTVRGLELTEDSIGLATSQSDRGTSCWIALDPGMGTLNIALMHKVKEDTPVGFLVVG